MKRLRSIEHFVGRGRGPVGSFTHPHLIPGRCPVYHRLQVACGVFPRRTVSVSACLHVPGAVEKHVNRHVAMPGFDRVSALWFQSCSVHVHVSLSCARGREEVDGEGGIWDQFRVGNRGRSRPVGAHPHAAIVPLGEVGGRQRVSRHPGELQNDRRDNNGFGLSVDVELPVVEVKSWRR